MKIGTLTLHLPFNYGNALQMFSLHKYLLEQGYDAEVLSHWFCKDQDEVLFHHHRVRTFKGIVHFVLDCLMFGGAFCQFIREAHLYKWLCRHIKWSKEEGITGEFPSATIPHDVIITGSDQIWNPKYETSDFFLLTEFSDKCKKIAYAASFGTDGFIERRKPFFRKCLKRFAAVSLRESSAVKIVNDELDGNGVLVCDPTLLHTREEWIKLLGINIDKKPSKDLMMYLVTPDFRGWWREVRDVAKLSGRRLHFFAFQWSHWVPQFSIRHPLSSVKMALSHIIKRIILWHAGVRLHLAATPSEFVECIANSNGLITDSFHGMMFATIFGKKCNVIVGEHEERQQMSARLRNFTSDYGRPEILTPKIDLNAMCELSVTPALEKLVNESKQWLKNAIER